MKETWSEKWELSTRTGVLTMGTNYFASQKSLKTEDSKPLVVLALHCETPILPFNILLDIHFSLISFIPKLMCTRGKNNS